MKQVKKEFMQQLTHFVDYQNRKVIFSEWFMKRIKDLSSDEYRQYLEVMAKAKGFKVEVIRVKAVPMRYAID